MLRMNTMDVRMSKNQSTDDNGFAEERENLHDLCRVCGRTSDHMTPLFKNDSRHNLSTKINKYLPMVVTANDTLPLQVCYTCGVVILAWHDLFERCPSVQQKLLQLETMPEKTVTDNQLLMKMLGDTTEKSGSNLEMWDTDSFIEKSFNHFQQSYYNETNSNPTYQENNSYSNNSSPQFEETSDGENSSSSSNKHVNLHQNSSFHPFQENNNIEIDKIISSQLNKCKKVSKSKEMISKARTVQNGRTVFNCKDCNKSFTTSYSLSAHMKIHSGQKLHECHLCKKHFGLKHNLTRHLLKIHRVTKTCFCSVCKKKVDCSNEVINIGDEYICESCKNPPKIHVNTANLFPNVETNDADCPVQCSYCPKFFPTEVSLLLHIEEHFGEVQYLPKTLPQ